MPANTNTNPPSAFEWLRGKRTRDIVLPPETAADPNLPPTSTDQLVSLTNKYKKSQKDEIMKGLYDAADGRK